MVDITTRLLLDTEIQVDGAKAGIIYNILHKNYHTCNEKLAILQYLPKGIHGFDYSKKKQKNMHIILTCNIYYLFSFPV